MKFFENLKSGEFVLIVGILSLVIVEVMSRVAVNHVFSVCRESSCVAREVTAINVGVVAIPLGMFVAVGYVTMVAYSELRAGGGRND